MIKINSILFILLFTSFFVACNKSKNKTEEIDFSKASMLQNVADEIIIPNYEQLESGVLNFEQKHNDFINSPSLSTFDDLKQSWKELYLSWNAVSMFDFGPAKDVALTGAIGTFPTDTVQILNNINNGGYDLATASNLKAIGIPAFDFLLYRSTAYNDYISDQAYQEYAGVLISKMKNEISTVLNSWKSTYKSTFINSTGTESSSAFSMMVNAFIKNYEDVKWSKLGIPLGKQTLDIQQPQYIESRYSKFSFELFLKNIETLSLVFKGGEGVGFDDYLIALDRSDLSNSIVTTFNQIEVKIKSFTTDFESALSSQTSELDELYTLIQNFTVSLKTDMTSAFGVLITYQDNDGD